MKTAIAVGLGSDFGTIFEDTHRKSSPNLNCVESHSDFGGGPYFY